MLCCRETLVNGAILSVIASCILLLSLYVNPRLYLQDYPRDVQAKAPPKTASEKRLALVLGVPFLLVLLCVPLLSTLRLKQHFGASASFPALALHASGVLWVFNVVDWLVLDWLMFCTWTPSFMVIPGTEGLPGYKDYGHHFRGFLVGAVLSLLAGLAIAGIASVFM